MYFTRVARVIFNPVEKWSSIDGQCSGFIVSKPYNPLSPCGALQQPVGSGASVYAHDKGLIEQIAWVIWHKKRWISSSHAKLRNLTKHANTRQSRLRAFLMRRVQHPKHKKYDTYGPQRPQGADGRTFGVCIHGSIVRASLHTHLVLPCFGS